MALSSQPREQVNAGNQHPGAAINSEVPNYRHEQNGGKAAPKQAPRAPQRRKIEQLETQV
jgi:hypothetical protein